MKSESYLQKIVYNDTIPYIPPITCGKVIKVYDGDTITIATKLPHEGSPVYRFSVRINGIDCPEIKTQDHNEHVCANIAKQKVCDMIFNKIIHLKNVKQMKYTKYFGPGNNCILVIIIIISHVFFTKIKKKYH